MSDLWRRFAKCRGMDPNLFFLELGTSKKAVEHARSICAACPVRRSCLEANLGEQHGIFGGTTVDERRKIRAARLAGVKYQTKGQVA